eukprot:gene1457-4877_t
MEFDDEKDLAREANTTQRRLARELEMDAKKDQTRDADTKQRRLARAMQFDDEKDRTRGTDTKQRRLARAMQMDDEEEMARLQRNENLREKLQKRTLDEKHQQRELAMEQKGRRAAQAVGEDLGPRRLCPFCGCATWKAEGSVCCNDGKHTAPPVQAPPRELIHWAGPSEDDPWKFRRASKNVAWNARKDEPEPRFDGVYMADRFSGTSRRMNCYFAFTAVATDVDNPDRHAEPPPGSFVRLAGRVYHYIPKPGSSHSSVPYYVHDTLPSTLDERDNPWVQLIHAVLMRDHPLAQTLRASRDVKATHVRVVPDPRKPKPECPSEICARWTISTGVEEQKTRCFIVFERDGGQC